MILILLYALLCVSDSLIFFDKSESLKSPVFSEEQRDDYRLLYNVFFTFYKEKQDFFTEQIDRFQLEFIQGQLSMENVIGIINEEVDRFEGALYAKINELFSKEEAVGLKQELDRLLGNYLESDILAFVQEEYYQPQKYGEAFKALILFVYHGLEHYCQNRIRR